MTTIPKYSAEHLSVRDTLIGEAVRAGKILASRTQHYQRLYDADPELTKHVLAQLQPAPGIAAASGAPPTQADSDYDPAWLTPAERNRITAASSGQQHAIAHHLHD
jgi:hypothetical protein